MKQKTTSSLVTSFVRPRNVMSLGNRSLRLTREGMGETEEKSPVVRKSYPMCRDTLLKDRESVLIPNLSRNKNPSKKQGRGLEQLKKQETAALDRIKSSSGERISQ